MALHCVLKNKNMIKVEWQKHREVYLSLIHSQDRFSRSDILPPKCHILKNKMKESKVQSVTSLKNDQNAKCNIFD